MNKLILLDIDGVLGDWVTSIINSLKLPITHDDVDLWDIHRKFGISDDDMWAVTEQPGWWEEIEPYSWANELIDYCKSRGDVLYCTSPGAHSNGASEKINWLRKHKFMGARKNDYVITKHKYLLANSGALLIDDSPKNYHKYQENGGKAVLFPQPWNDNRAIAGFRVQYAKNMVKLYA